MKNKILLFLLFALLMLAPGEAATSIESVLAFKSTETQEFALKSYVLSVPYVKPIVSVGLVDSEVFLGAGIFFCTVFGTEFEWVCYSDGRGSNFSIVHTFQWKVSN